jgi:hypothetical protein
MTIMMKKKSSIFALTLLLICMLSLAFSTSLVQAKDPTIGKELIINFIGEGYVKAEKVKSGETWYFYPGDEPEKVGAGTVLLTAYADAGWSFFEWSENVVTPSVNPTDYKTEKYGVVTVTFVKTFTITPSISDIGTGTGTIDPNVPVTVYAGDYQTVTFAPDAGSHVSAIIVDGVYQGIFALEYTFVNIQQDHTIEVVFDEEGQTTVPAGDSNVFLAPTAGMAFTGATSGTVSGGEVTYALGAGAWELIIVDFTYDGLKLTLTYNDAGLSEADELALFLVKAETIEALRSDVNGDLVVNGDDVSDVANAVKHLIWYDARYDINDDSFVNEDDVHIVNENKGAILEPIYVDGINVVIDIDADTITFSPEHLCIFGVR